MWRRPDACAWIQENKRTESLKTHQDGAPEMLTLMGAMHSDKIFSRNWPRNISLTTPPWRLTWKKGLSTWRYAPHKKKTGNLTAASLS